MQIRKIEKENSRLNRSFFRVSFAVALGTFLGLKLSSAAVGNFLDFFRLNRIGRSYK